MERLGVRRAAGEDTRAPRGLGVWTLAGLLVLGSAGIRDGQAAPVRFNRDIRPILAENCLACHGPDQGQRKSGLRLDQRADALHPAKSGAAAIVPGQPDESELLRRIFRSDPDEVMPPPDSPKQLTSAQKELLRQWILEGASYEAHWSFVPPTRPELPPVRLRRWPRNDIDRIVLAGLEAKGLEPSPEADRTTLLRRLSLDLTGLPPSTEEVDAFLRDTSAGAYERVVDRLLRSPHYGERMAVDWLDAARFADSNGYQVDRDREMYAWRDWVIRAFNTNQRFDEFTIDQIAGDLRPNATFEQRIATGFHRNHMANEEGGIIPEEFLAEYCADRVETTATVWLGLTFNCARCHDHKFDPFTQRDYYGLFAYFHNVTEKGVGDYGANIRRNNPPMIQLPAPELEAKRARLKEEQAVAQRRRETVKMDLSATQAAWEQRVIQSEVIWSPVDADFATATLQTGSNAPVVLPWATEAGIALPALTKGRYVLAIEFGMPVPKATALRLTLQGTSDATNQTHVLSELSLSRTQSWRERPLALAGTNAPSARTPWPLRALEMVDSVTAADAATALEKGKKPLLVRLRGAGKPSFLIYEVEPLDTAAGVSSRLRWTIVADEPLSAGRIELAVANEAVDRLVPSGIRSVLARERDDSRRTPEERKRVADFRVARSREHRLLTAQLSALTKQIDEVELQIPTALVMEEKPEPRVTHILMRGAYDRKGDAVEARTPAALPPMNPAWPRNRLGLAYWLTDPGNPLPARVAVNRFWQAIFGSGLVATAEDFGVQGEPASHPELLDWLATEFVRSGWDVKAMMRLLVTSATYRQSSKRTAGGQAFDPLNRQLARGPRFRLPAEFLRDQALAASGLLVLRIGGPSVRPYHPPGLYEQVVAGSGPATYVVGKGEDLHRRSLYTYWKRSVPNPAMLLFDAPFRETCAVRRPRTNTPLQALNLMNDPTFVEAARFLAQRAMRAGAAPEERLVHALRLVAARRPTGPELSVLRKALERELRQFRADRHAALQWLKVGDAPGDPAFDPSELAAYAIVCSLLLNLDEVVTKE